MSTHRGGYQSSSRLATDLAPPPCRMMIPWPDERWDPPEVAIRLTDGPFRIYDDNPTPPLPSRPVGFRIEPEIEPLLWDGDNA